MENKTMTNSKSPFRLSIGILAGGESTRMGENKALLKWGKECLLERIARELSFFSTPIISAADKGTYERFGYPVVYDENKKAGPMEGLRRLLTAASENYVFVCATDLPGITKELVSYLMGYVSSDYDCFVFRDEEHVHPLCAIYSKRVLPVLEVLMAKGVRRIMTILDEAPTKYVTLEHTDFPKNIFQNINDKKAYFELRKPFVFCVSGFSNSGKTTLIEKLIGAFRSENLSVGVIKHDGHGAVRDAYGTDTERFIKAGALSATIFSEDAWLSHTREITNADALLQRMKQSGPSADVIILEGLKDSRHPKIVLCTEADAKELLGGVIDPRSILCLAMDGEKKLSADGVRIPVFDRNDTVSILRTVKDYFCF